ncbi:hypothetical protein BC952_1215 [Flavobacterium limicola]|uniref:Uncharacterized protein n=1 Tax=Flavobacterium limicola TaxID=180441 RepID=A0A495S6S2_9FLAO|nr:hypothetical protein [Flavobacterium limicola]RKS95525.1 hypothetical protein BC952_1215 [Flavobacterium limicola]
MKIFKLKHIAVVLIAGLLVSCTATDTMPEVEQNATIETDGLPIENGTHYVINGSVTNDINAVKIAAKDAWNIHYDYSKNKIVISTTPSEFEKYKKIDLEFASRLNESTIEKSSARVAATELIPALPSHSGRLVFYYEYGVGTNFDQVFHFARRDVPDTSVAFESMRHVKGVQVPDGSFSFNVVLTGMFSYPTTSTNTYQIHVINHSSTSKTFTAYAGKNYSGESKSVTVAKYSDKRLYAGTFKFQNGTNVADSFK